MSEEGEEMTNTVESKTEIQVDVPLTEDAKRRCAGEMLNAMSAISIAVDDIKDYKAEKKEELEKWQGVVSEARNKASQTHLSDDAKLVYATEIIEALNAMSEIEDDLKSFEMEKKAEISKNEAIVNISRIKISRGKDRAWIEVKLVKDYDKKIKTYANLKTGEVVKTLPMTDEDLQMPLAE